MATFFRNVLELAAEANLGTHPLLSAATLDLLKAPVTLDGNLTVAGCVAQIADFTGYAQVALTVPPLPYPDLVQGGVSLTLPTMNFVCSNPTTVGNNIYGFYITRTGVTAYPAFACLFNQYIPMNNPAEQLNLEVSINFFGAQGILCTVNGQLV